MVGRAEATLGECPWRMRWACNERQVVMAVMEVKDKPWKRASEQQVEVCVKCIQ